MNIKKNETILICIILLSFIISSYLYPHMPQKIASHWNAQGQVDGYMSKFWGLFMLPFILFGLFLLFIAIPKIDPLKENIEKFRKHYDLFVIFFIIFLFYVYLLTVLWNVGFRFDLFQLLVPALSALFYYIGVLIENSKMNWFIGIRTPWTLSNEKVWNKTHKIGGKMFKIAGFIALVGFFFENYALFLTLIPVIFIAIYTFVYSYNEYQKETKVMKDI